MADALPFKTSGEILVFGHETKEWIKADLPELRKRHLSFAGITHARQPYRIIRPHFLDGHILATVDGEGELWQAGAWRRLGAGDIFVNPPGFPEAFRARPRQKWQFGWLHARPEFFETYAFQKSQVFRADPRPFHLALQGYLNHEPANSPPGTLELWADLVSTHACHLMQFGKKGTRLWKLWETVVRDPGLQWDIDKLAGISGLSREQLRYHSLLETGHAPMHHVAYLRVQRALTLLQTTKFTLESISGLVGYGNPFALSNVVFKMTGKRPSYYRQSASRDPRKIEKALT